MKPVDAAGVEGSAETLGSWERPSSRLVIMVVESILEKKMCLVGWMLEDPEDDCFVCSGWKFSFLRFFLGVLIVLASAHAVSCS